MELPREYPDQSEFLMLETVNIVPYIHCVIDNSYMLPSYSVTSITSKILMLMNDQPASVLST
ncbi:hypothetical protein, partial [Salmonella enterica]|uniref:hypothetical protein n=1 Tax=Salmonella enterica TaxID=28901 RepID=UPI001CB761FF